VRLSPETCRVKPLRRIKTQLLHLVGLISLLFWLYIESDSISRVVLCWGLQYIKCSGSVCIWNWRPPKWRSHAPV